MYTVYTFQHSELGVFIGTNNELRHKYPELSSGNISKVARGLRTHHKGWDLKSGVHQERDLQKIEKTAKVKPKAETKPKPAPKKGQG